jgi:hypothetical protein
MTIENIDASIRALLINPCLQQIAELLAVS